MVQAVAFMVPPALVYKGCRCLGGFCSHPLILCDYFFYLYLLKLCSEYSNFLVCLFFIFFAKTQVSRPVVETWNHPPFKGGKLLQEN